MTDPLRAALEEVFEPYLRLAGMALPTMAKVLDGATARLAAYHGVRAALAADTAPLDVALVRHGLEVLHSPHFGWGCNAVNCSGQAALDHLAEKEATR